MVFGGPAGYGWRVARRKASKDDEPTRGTAPSAADIRDLDKMEASDEAKAHVPSEVDAQGQDKRRQVIGHAYGPSKKTQFVFFIAVAAVVAILAGGYLLAIAKFDQPEDTYADEAPWSQTDAQQIPTLAPGNPCGEPGNPYPADEDSPCRSRAGLTAEQGPRSPGSEEGPGGVTDGGSESASDSQ